MNYKKERIIIEEYQLSIEKVTFKADESTILDAVSFQVKKGERVTVTGPSGGGKSTLLKIIGSIQKPTEGRILFKGKNIAETDPLAYRQSVSYFFQNASLFGKTVKDNLIFPFQIRELPFDQKRCEQMLERVKLDRSYINKAVNDLSGGEKQRVALVRNLIFQPDVLLLDEVTSSLDSDNKEIIFDMLAELKANDQITVISVTHDEREISQADRVLRIIDGKLEESV
ncbi:YbbL ABC transporter ATP-binding protein [Alkalibacterium sp. AK22]|uniref:ABC transporter ATP-binding protein n=1 Tax=Alkalibacterium sp. AK22 TaxID=1229520 RepID=UPI00044D84A6|nr:ATP-binding cassette domain-containing protein [Alkalibacterium sp. AK22]EXJ23614.1 YbbL ABC transporter ATP-binding protein [Alkalibacterium sp. AK22]